MHLKFDDIGPESSTESLTAGQPRLRHLVPVPNCETCIQSFLFPRKSTYPIDLSQLPDDGYVYRTRTDSLLTILRFGLLNEVMREQLLKFTCTLDEADSFSNLSKMMRGFSAPGSIHENTFLVSRMHKGEFPGPGELIVVPDQAVLIDSKLQATNEADSVLLPTAICSIVCRHPEDIYRGFLSQLNGSVQTFIRERYWNRDAAQLLSAPLWLFSGFSDDESLAEHLLQLEEDVVEILSYRHLLARVMQSVRRISKTFPFEITDSQSFSNYLTDISGIHLSYLEAQRKSA